MSIGLSINDFGYGFLLAVPAFLVPFVLLGIGSLIGRVLRLDAWWFPIAFALGVVAAALFGGAAYLDTAGQKLDGLITKKRENVRIRSEGDWVHEFRANVHYKLDGSTLSVKTISLSDGSVAYLPDASASNAGLSLRAQHYDKFKEGERVQLRVLPFFRSIALVKLVDASIKEFLPWDLIYAAGAIIVIGRVLFKLAGSGRLGLGLAFLIGLAVVMGVPSYITVREWRVMEDLQAKPLRATATVTEVTRITKINPLPCGAGDCSDSIDTEFDVPQQYDIVQMTFVPQGGRDAVLAVDAADVGSMDVEQGGTVELAYNQTDPRAAQILGATHTHHYKNMLGFVGYVAALGGVMLVISLGWSWLTGGFKKKLKTG
jgi:hypothetical protein